MQIDENDLNENKLYSTMTDVEYVLRFFAMRQLEGESLETAKDNIVLLVRSLIKLGVIRSLISGVVLSGEEEIPFDGEHLSSIC